MNTPYDWDDWHFHAVKACEFGMLAGASIALSSLFSLAALPDVALLLSLSGLTAAFMVGVCLGNVVRCRRASR